MRPVPLPISTHALPNTVAQAIPACLAQIFATTPVVALQACIRLRAHWRTHWEMPITALCQEGTKLRAIDTFAQARAIPGLTDAICALQFAAEDMPASLFEEIWKDHEPGEDEGNALFVLFTPYGLALRAECDRGAIADHLEALLPYAQAPEPDAELLDACIETAQGHTYTDPFGLVLYEGATSAHHALANHTRQQALRDLWGRILQHEYTMPFVPLLHHAEAT